jgi:hypothetical protein
VVLRTRTTTSNPPLVPIGPPLSLIQRHYSPLATPACPTPGPAQTPGPADASGDQSSTPLVAELAVSLSVAHDGSIGLGGGGEPHERGRRPVRASPLLVIPRRTVTTSGGGGHAPGAPHGTGQRGGCGRWACREDGQCTGKFAEASACARRPVESRLEASSVLLLV